MWRSRESESVRRPAFVRHLRKCRFRCSACRRDCCLVAEYPHRHFVLSLGKPLLSALSAEVLKGYQKISEMSTRRILLVLVGLILPSLKLLRTIWNFPVEIHITPLKSCNFSGS